MFWLVAHPEGKTRSRIKVLMSIGLALWLMIDHQFSIKVNLEASRETITHHMNKIALRPSISGTEIPSPSLTDLEHRIFYPIFRTDDLNYLHKIAPYIPKGSRLQPIVHAPLQTIKAFPPMT